MIDLLDNIEPPVMEWFARYPLPTQVGRDENGLHRISLKVHFEDADKVFSGEIEAVGTSLYRAVLAAANKYSSLCDGEWKDL